MRAHEFVRRLTRHLLFAGPLTGALAAPAAAKVETSHDGTKTIMRFALEGMSFSNATVAGSPFVTARIEGANGFEGIAYEPGMPEIPVLRFFADGDVRVIVDESALESGTASARLKPSQNSRVKLPTAEPEFTLDLAAYSASEATPAGDFAIEAAGSINGVARKLVTLKPFHYVPKTGKWTMKRSFTVEITGTTPEGIEGEREIFAFVVGERFKDSPSLARYMQLKEDLGYLVETIVVAQTDTPEIIRGKLKEVYARTDAKLKHALIVGEATDVPGKPSDNISGVTDHFYRAIDTADYATDINGPDIGVGRVSADSEAQLAVVLGKFTRYIGGQFSEEGWLSEIAWLATDDRYEVAEGTHNYVIDTYTTARGYTGVFPNAVQQGGDKLYAITHQVPDAKVVEVMGMGRTIIDYSGHGSNTSWAGPNVSQTDVRSLTDTNALPFVISNACITGDFRVSESFAETWQRHNAGAIMFWGSMDSTYWDEDDILERRMFDGIFQGGFRAFGKITDHALSEHWRHYGGEGKSKYYWETYVTFGDPSLDLRVRRARAVTLEGPAALPVGVGSVSYVVSDAEGPVQGARVALGVPGRTLRTSAISDADGRVTFDLTAAARDVATLLVTVSGAESTLGRKELSIVPADTPYLSLSQFNANGADDLGVHLGESAALGFSVQNLGQRPTRGGRIEVTKVEGPARFTGSTLTVPALAARAAFRVNGDDLSFAIDDDASAQASIKVELTWTTEEGQTAVVPVTLRVKRATLQVTGVDFGEQGGISPGDSGSVFVTVINRGNEAIRDAVLNAEPGSCIESLRGSLIVEGLAPGASLRIDQPLTATVASTCRNGDTAQLAIAGDYASVAMRVPLQSAASFVAGVLSVQRQELQDLTLAIPDNGAPVEQDITADVAGILTEIGVHVRLTHTYIGDLRISIVHPDGTEVALHDRTGGSTANIDQVYGYEGQAVPGLAALAGKPSNGTWKLRIQDQASSDTGTLTYVKLSLRGYLN